jgi:hypothetical protein
MNDEDWEQEMKHWEETHGDSEGNLKDCTDEEKDVDATGGQGEAEKDGDGDVEKGKEVIDVEDEEKKRKPMAARSSMWEHFTKILDKGKLVKAKCNYCGNEIATHPVLNGTSAMHKHFNTCKRNPHKGHDDAQQGVLSVTQGHGTSVGTWKFDQELIRSAFAEMIIEDEEPFGHGEKLGFRKFMLLALGSLSLLEGHVLGTRCSCTLSRKQNLKCSFKKFAIEFVSQLMVGHHSNKIVT